MQLTSIIKGGIYKIDETTDNTNYGFYLVIGGTSGLKTNATVQPDVSCFRCNRNPHSDYDVPHMQGDGRYSFVSTDAIYSFPTRMFDSRHFIGVLSDTSFCTMKEFLEMCFNIYAYSIGMTDDDPIDALDEYKDNFYASFKEAPEQKKEREQRIYVVNHKNRASICSSMGPLVEKAMRMGPSEAMERGQSHMSVINEQKKFAENLSKFQEPVKRTPAIEKKIVITSPIDEKDVPTKTVHARKASTKEIEDLVQDFKVNYFDKIPSHSRKNSDAFCNEFLPLYELLRETGDVQYFAEQLGYTGMSSIYNMYVRYKEDYDKRHAVAH